MWGKWMQGSKDPPPAITTIHLFAGAKLTGGQAKHPFDAAGSTAKAAPRKSLLQEVDKMPQDWCVRLCDLSNLVQVHLLECRLIIAVANA